MANRSLLRQARKPLRNQASSVEGTARLTPKGGASLNLGVDDVVDFAMNELRTKDIEHYVALEASSMRLILQHQRQK
jgi:hypothetical protein